MSEAVTCTEPSAGDTSSLYRRLLEKFARSNDLLETHPRLLIVRSHSPDATLHFCFGDAELRVLCHIQAVDGDYYTEMAVFSGGYRTTARRIQRILADIETTTRALEHVSTCLRLIEPSARPVLLDLVRRAASTWN